MKTFVPLHTRPPRGRLRWASYAVAAAAALTLLPITIVVLINSYAMGGSWAGALGVAQTLPLVMAVTRPLPAWGLVLCADVAGAVVLTGADGTAGHPWPWTPTGIIGYLLLMALLGMQAPARTLAAVWTVTAVTGAVLSLYQPHGSGNLHVLLTVLSAVVLALAAALTGLGDARQRIAEQESVSEAERARRTLLEERTRIARELHDVVAHHMSVITVQADSAPYRLPNLPPSARDEFAAIAASARESLTEMRRLLTVLRSDAAEDGQAGPETLLPQPGVARLPQLVESTVRSGLQVEFSLGRSLAEAQLPPAVDLSAYRIVQEALANVLRHAPGADTRVSVSEEGTEMVVLVVNGPARGAPVPLEASGTGHGLVGMRERVRLTGGTLEAGALPDGGFRVAARFPLTEEV